jgi:hypothetical protein
MFYITTNIILFSNSHKQKIQLIQVEKNAKFLKNFSLFK